MFFHSQLIASLYDVTKSLEEAKKSAQILGGSVGNDLFRELHRMSAAVNEISKKVVLAAAAEAALPN